MTNHKDFKKDLTAEEKKAQRAAKAAEKKARAEAAATKKNSQAPQSNGTATVKAAPKPPVERKQENAPIVVKKEETPLEITKKEEVLAEKLVEEIVQLAVSSPKSALKIRNCGPGEDKEIKFDLTVYQSDKVETVGEEEPDHYHPPYSRVPIDVHHAFSTLNNRCENEQIMEIDELCKAFIIACKEMYAQYFNGEFQISKNANKNKVSLLNRQIEYILEHGKWSLPPALNNLFRMTKRQLQKIDDGLSAEDAAEIVLDELEILENTYLLTAHKMIVFHLESKLTKAKHIVVFKGNKFIEDSWEILVKRNISVSVVEDEFMQSENKSSAIDLAQSLSAKGIDVNITDLKGIAHVLPHASLAVLPSNAVFLSGGVSCPKGGHQVAEVAKHFNVPVIVCAQAYKFVDQVQHIGRTALLRKQNSEMIPSEFITALITEIRILPPSSAPAVIKAKIGDLNFIC